MSERHDVLALVKPQFELGRARVGKGGVVRAAAERRAALLGVAQAALELGAGVLGFHSSGLPGPKGNRETFIWLCEPARLAAAGRRATGAAGGLDARAQERLAAMVREAEP
jgi:23S rRNA (cytidine1920-2'-O)/16S rRNA (cytidine1409-2'-O)-methyltransferase